MDDLRMRSSRRSRLAIVAVLTVMAFAVTLALVIGHRLSNEALAVLAGAVCGVGAAIPTSLLVIAVSRRRDERGLPPVQQGPYPPVVVVSPPGGRQLPGDWGAFPSSLTAPVERQFTVVGEGQKAQRVDTEVRTYGRYS
jgi:hypothetical protein